MRDRQTKPPSCKKRRSECFLVDDADLEALLKAPGGFTDFWRRASTKPTRLRTMSISKKRGTPSTSFSRTAWEGLHPLNFIAVGGESVGDEDVGYGPARALRWGDVAALAGALATFRPPSS